jgi:ferric-dicitrate binding protein FerR (iron transport regulator)
VNPKHLGHLLMDKTESGSDQQPVRRERHEDQFVPGAGPGHEESLDDDLKRVWRQVGILAPDLSKISDSPPAEAIIRVAAAESAAGPFRMRLGWRRVWWAASAAALLLLGFGIVRLRLGDRPRLAAAGTPEYSTGPGEMATVRFDDGSVARLAPVSRLSFTRGQDGNRVDLDGQAFFAVAPQERGAFVVRTPLGQAHVLGTRFEVRARDDSLSILVVEGRVALAVGGNEVELNRGQLALAAAGARPAVATVEDVYDRLDWMGAWLVFNATPLSQVADEIQRRFGPRVVVTDEEVSRRTVTALFADARLEEIVTVVCRVVQATCVLEDSTVTISRRIAPAPGSPAR